MRLFYHKGGFLESKYFDKYRSIIYNLNKILSNLSIKRRIFLRTGGLFLTIFRKMS